MRFPTLLGIVLFALFVGGFVVVFERLSRNPSQASQAVTPKEVNITNVTDGSFTISWITDAETTGVITLSAEKFKSQTIYDERDRTGKLGSYLTHSLTFRSAQGSTTYAVKILSNGKTFLDNGKPYQVTTGPTLSGNSGNLEPAYGTIMAASGQPAEGALVYLTAEGGQKMSTLVTPSGSWVIPLNLLRSEGLLKFLPQEERITEHLAVRLGNDVSVATTDTLNDSPVPEIRLGKTYDFRRQQAQEASEIASNPSEVLGDSNMIADGLVTITKPVNGASLTSSLPLIQGTGVAGKKISITLGINNPIGGSTTVDSDSIWRYTPTKPLSPGKQSVTITTIDAKNVPVAITHTFEILKSGTQVLGEATLSATPTLSATSSPTPTSTLAGEPLPESGNMLPTIILLLLGLGLLASGTVVFIK